MDFMTDFTPRALEYRLTMVAAQLRVLEATYRDSGADNRANLLNGIISDIDDARKFFASLEEDDFDYDE